MCNSLVYGEIGWGEAAVKELLHHHTMCPSNEKAYSERDLSEIIIFSALQWYSRSGKKE